jgi:hypothetical protein
LFALSIETPEVIAMSHQISFGVLLVAIFAIGLICRMATSSRWVIAILLVIGLGLATTGLYQVRGKVRVPPPKIVHVNSFSPPLPAEVSARATTAARPKRPGKTKPADPSRTTADEPPPAPPVAADAATVEEESPKYVVYRGTSTIGTPTQTLPSWVAALANSEPGSNPTTITSDQFATVEEAEEQLWTKARDLAARDLRERTPEAVGWSPSKELLKQRGLILERCVERTSLQVGAFSEPMFRVYWKLRFSDDLRQAVADAWRPTVQESRIQMVAAGFIGWSLVLGAINLLLRAIASRAAVPAQKMA